MTGRLTAPRPFAALWSAVAGTVPAAAVVAFNAFGPGALLAWTAVPVLLPACLLAGTSLNAAAQPDPAASAASAAQPAPPARRAVARPARRVASDQDADAVVYGQREDAQRLADELAARHGLDAAWARRQLAQARYQPAVARLIMPPPAGTAKNWVAYRSRFLTADRIRAGAAFWATHEATLQAAEARFGVPAETVVGIIGVETFYGRIMGNFRVLDALATLSLDFPTGRKDRTPFFRDELGHFLALSHAQGQDPTSLRGSFAGAMGLGQFMPGSIQRWAVDFDQDGRIDMAANPVDVIGSVANYLAQHGWQRGQPTHFAVKPPVDTSARARLLAPDILPSFSVQQLQEAGAVLDAAAAPHPGPLALIELQNGDAAPTYVAGTQNFYAITRYNWSAYYAMAVVDLGRAVAAARLVQATR